MISQKDQQHLLKLIAHLEEVNKTSGRELQKIFGFSKKEIIDNNLLTIKIVIDNLR